MNKFHVTLNSKEVRHGSIFFALKGTQHDGRNFIPEALANGASRIFSEEAYDHPLVSVLGKDVRKKLGELASESFGVPTRKLKMIGITGTSGKTTTSYLVQHILNSSGFECARIGTNGTSFRGNEQETKNTTPDAVELQKYFSEVLNQGATHVVMEVSSHALHQDRVWGICWDVVAFLNLSPEHMDYHPSLEDYFQAKSLLFFDHVRYSIQHGKAPKIAVSTSNAYGSKLFAKLQNAEEFSAMKNVTSLTTNTHGLSGCIKIQDEVENFSCPMYGDFQIENILAAVKICVQLNVPFKKCISALKNFPGVPGRMELVSNKKNILAFVDYAHKPEALEKVLLSIQPSQSTQKLICVFGCGGDRDKTKRPVMGSIAARLSDYVILTSDNPRTESPLQILSEIEEGLKSEITNGRAKTKHFEVIEDREQAIHRAVELAQPGDIILIAGKGHENYQIIGSAKRSFDDRLIARKALT